MPLRNNNCKVVCWLKAINWLFPRNENWSKIFINWLWFLEWIIRLIDRSQKVSSRNPSPECNYVETRLASWKMRWRSALVPHAFCHYAYHRHGFSWWEERQYTAWQHAISWVTHRRVARNSHWGECFGGLKEEPPALENFAFFCKNSLILELF